MISDIQEHVRNTPFVPFRIHMADGREYSVPTIDHIYFPPKSGRVVITNDDGVVSMLPALLIRGLVVPSASPEHLTEA